MNSTGQNLHDALNPRLAGSTEGMTLQVLAQIRDSLTMQNRDIRTTSEAISDVRERVIRLEESNRRLEVVEGATKDHNTRLDVLEQDKLRREGAIGLIGLIKVWGPFVFSLLAALWLYGRSLGIIPAPPVPAAKVEAVIQPDDRSIKGIVGGKTK